MSELETKIQEAFDLADQALQKGNAGMINVKLSLQRTAAHFSPALAAQLNGRLGVGSALASANKKSFVWRGELPGAGKKKGKNTARPAVAKEKPVKELPELGEKGKVSEEPEAGLYEKLASLPPVKIAAEYKDSIQEIAAALGVTFEEGWNAPQRAAAIRKAAQQKIAAA